MTRDKNQYSDLISRYRNGSCSQEDLQKIKELLDDAEFIIALEKFWDDEFVGNNNEIHTDKETRIQEILLDSRIVNNRNQILIKQQSLQKKAMMFKIAAAITIFGIATLLFIYWNGTSVFSKSENLMVHNTEIFPGRQTAKILFDDGSSVDLESIKGDTIIVRPEFLIHKTSDGKITYQFKHNPQVKKTIYNTIVTPKGGEYNLSLPDGTRVWLNAMTRLRYPINFDSQIREVHLEGETFFEVAKVFNKGTRVPFVVHSQDQSLEVLGTAFNVSNYGSEVITTLTEGKVKLTYPQKKGIDEKYLSPNEQSIYHAEDGKFSKSTVDPFYFMAWKNGNFAFDNASIYEVMDAIGRWYDVEIRYHGNLEKVRFSGAVSRYENIDKLLKTISLAGGVQFDLKERRVDVM